jgi:hypothetical protein
MRKSNEIQFHRRRNLLKRLGLAMGGGLLLPVPLAVQAATPLPLVEVWKDPSCGCCHDWINHLRANGFRVQSYDTGNTAKRAELGISAKLGSCHTAKVGGYALEGHVPAREIHRLLKEKPVAVGLAVPGMPIGSPGMDGAAYGHRTDAYNVLLIHRDSTTSVFQSY